jgi:hypothetical protein
MITKSIPPITGFFQAKIKAITKSRAGIFSIKSPIIFCDADAFALRTSKDKRAMKIMHTIAKTLGNQTVNNVFVFIIFNYDYYNFFNYFLSPLILLF